MKWQWLHASNNSWNTFTHHYLQGKNEASGSDEIHPLENK
jgi:hypothetical protein